MAGPDAELVEVSLLSGHSARPSISFAPGAPAPTVSVGSGGQWSVTAEGVAPVHVFLAFDGQAVHVASAVPHAPVLLAGSPVGMAWTRAPVPCELRFGGACLILRRVPRPGAAPTEDATMYDGGALLAAAAAAKQRASVTPSPVTHPLGGASSLPSVRPAAGTPPDTARVGPPAMPDAPRPGVPDLGSTVPLADPHGFHEAVLAATEPRPPPDSAPTQVQAPVAGAPAPPPLDWEKTVVAPHPPGFAVPAPLPAPYAGPSAPEPPPMAAMPPTPTVGTVPPATGGGPTAKALEAWRASSPVKKATLVLLPFALVGALFIMRDEPAPPPRPAHPPATASSVAAAARDADAPAQAVTSPDASASGSEIAASNQVGTPDAPPRGAALPPGRRTPEREALDTAAAGAFEDAAKRYDVLATSHPDDPSYKEAARILRAKAGN